MAQKNMYLLIQKDIELLQTRDAYDELMGDFVAIQRNIDEVLGSLDNAKNKDIAKYKRQAMVMEDKIKQISDFWLSNKFLERFKAIGDKYIKELEATNNEKFGINQKPLRITR